jgi:hypothetical protein
VSLRLTTTKTQKLFHDRSTRKPPPASSTTQAGKANHVVQFTVAQRDRHHGQTIDHSETETTAIIPAPTTTSQVRVTQPTKLNMSCTFLDKLAPETRSKIYEYALSFDTPLKHVTQLQPFIKKLTTVVWEASPSSIGFEVEAATSTTSDGTSSSLQRVNTSLLTASKLIYTEAVATFYKHNTIHIDAQEICNSGTIIWPRETDLSLATQIVSKLEPAATFEDLRRGLCVALTFAVLKIPAIFPNLRTASIHISPDSMPNPEARFFTTATMLRHTEACNPLVFDRVGSLATSIKSQPCITIVMQSRQAMDRWDAHAEDILPNPITFTNVHARTLYRGSRADPQSACAPVGTRPARPCRGFWTC